VPEATSEIWSAFSDSLRAFIRGRVRADADADDILQEVFIRIHAGLDGLEDRAKVRAWLFQIARRAISDHYRATGARASAEPRMLAARAGKDATLNAEVAGWLTRLMAGLSEADRRALELSELRGLSEKQVAGELGLTLTAAKSRIQRARRRLKDVLQQCCSIELDRRGNAIAYARRHGDCGHCSCD
jgi:RNA polymerase sigma-70 factor, ECF subfamily